MKKAKKISVLFAILLSLFIITLFFPGNSQNSTEEKSLAFDSVNAKSLQVYYFYGEGCSHCAKVAPFLEEIETKYPIQINKYDIYTDRDKISLFDEYSDRYGIPSERRGVPTIFISEDYFIGDGAIIGNFEEAVKNALNEKPDFSTRLNKEEIEETNYNSIGSTEQLSLFAITVSALVDAVSPCSIAILVFLIGARVLVSGFRKRALKVGLAFCLSIFIGYFLFGIGLFNVIQFSGFSGIFSVLVGTVAVVVGLLYLKDVFWYRRGGFAMEVPNSLKPALMKILKRVTSPFGAFLMGFVVVLFEMPCTGGPYLFILGQLANNTTRLQTIPLLFYYNFIFVLPLVVITLLLYSKVLSLNNIRTWNEKNLRMLRLGSGLVMIFLGLLVFPASIILSFLNVFLAVFRATGLLILVSIFVHYLWQLRKTKIRPFNRSKKWLSHPSFLGVFLTLPILTAFILMAASPSSNSTTVPQFFAHALEGETINSCMTISSPGNYTFGSNILDSSAGTCITVTSSDVVLDGQNHRIDGVGSSNSIGVFVNNPSGTVSNVVVKNLIVSNWHYGIYFSDVLLSDIENNRVNENSRGIYLYQSSSNSLTSNSGSGYNSESSYAGIHLLQSNWNLIVDNSISSYWVFGIYLSSSSNNHISRNTLKGQGQGLELTADSADNVIEENLIQFNKYGIEFESGCDNNLIVGNEITHNNLIGINLVSADNNVIRSNIIEDNYEYPNYKTGIGIRLENCKDNLIFDNSFNNYQNCYYNNWGCLSCSETWNIEKTLGQNIVGGPYLGGNYWGGFYGHGFGFSDQCSDADGDYFCDSSYSLGGVGIDYLPLKEAPADTTPPTGSIVINGGAASTSSTSVTLTLTYADATSGVDKVRYTNAYEWGSEPWETPVTSKAWTLSPGDGEKIVSYQIRDNAGLTSNYYDSIILDTTPPTGSIVINGGAASTSSTSVTLTSTYADATSGVDKVRYTNAYEWGSEPWETPVTSKAWTLTSGEGTKYVSYQVRDNAGHISHYWDDINLEADKVATPTFNPSGGTYPSSQSVTLSCATSDATIRYTTDGSEPTASSTAYSSPILVNSGTITIKAKAFKTGMTDSDTATETYKIIPPDEDAPTTQHDYDGLLHINKLTITLTATDNNEVAETYYRINNGPILTISANGQPEITIQGDDNKLEFWSIDKTGNEERPHNVLTGIRLVIRDNPILIT